MGVNASLKTEVFPSVPGVGTSDVLIGNFGFGIAF